MRRGRFSTPHGQHQASLQAWQGDGSGGGADCRPIPGMAVGDSPVFVGGIPRSMANAERQEIFHIEAIPHSGAITERESMVLQRFWSEIPVVKSIAR